MNDNKYDLIAKSFASIRDKSLREKEYIDALVKDLPNDAHILDIGCGTGEPISAYLLKLGFNVTGMDSSKELLKIAQKKFPSMHFWYGDMRTISLNNTYEAIIAWDSFFHLPKEDQKNMFLRFKSWLKKNGKLLFTSGDVDGEILNAEMLGERFSYYSFSPKMYQTLLTQHSFSILLREQDQKHHCVWIAQLDS